jgi:hypothetical protein
LKRLPFIDTGKVREIEISKNKLSYLKFNLRKLNDIVVVKEKYLVKNPKGLYDL